MFRIFAIVFAFLAAIVFTPVVNAQEYPSRPITLVVPFPPGGGTDIAARALAERMSESLGKPVVVLNRGGAAGMIGTTYVAHSAPDGYTIVMGTQGTHASNESLFKDMNYKTIDDFSPIAYVASTSLILVTKATEPIETVQQLLGVAKSRTDKPLFYASSSIGGSPHLAMELFDMMSGIKMVHVPYQGSAPARTALLSGEVTVMFDNIPSSLPLVREGSFRALGVSGAKRDPAAPDVPTVAEAGVPGFEMLAWYALFAPAGTPRPIVDKLNASVNQALRSPNLIKTFANLGLNPEGGTPEQLASIVKTDVDKYHRLVATVGLQKN